MHIGNSKHITYAMLSEAFDTLRLLADLMDFSDENGDGWAVFEYLCEYVHVPYGELEDEPALLLWMLRLSSFELKTYSSKKRFASMLSWTQRPGAGLEEASNLLLNLSGMETIDAGMYTTDGYTALHYSFDICLLGGGKHDTCKGPRSLSAGLRLRVYAAERLSNVSCNVLVVGIRGLAARIGR